MASKLTMPTVTPRRRCPSLRLNCFFIGYMNLIASIVDITSHILVAGILSSAFQCDINEDAYYYVDWPWFQPILLAINLGTHGFYPFPLILGSKSNLMEYTKAQPKCYPGMFHVYFADVLNIIVNVIWFKFCKAYVTALHQKDPEPMRMFFGMTLVKLVFQLMYFSFQPPIGVVSTVDGYWFLKVADIAMTLFYLRIVYKYLSQLKEEKALSLIQAPPSYVQCLQLNAPTNFNCEKSEKNHVELSMPIEIPEKHKL